MARTAGETHLQGSISNSGSSVSETRMVSPRPSIRRDPMPMADFMRPSSPSPASVTLHSKKKIQTVCPLIESMDTGGAHSSRDIMRIAQDEALDRHTACISPEQAF